MMKVEKMTISVNVRKAIIKKMKNMLEKRTMISGWSSMTSTLKPLSMKEITPKGITTSFLLLRVRIVVGILKML